MADKASEGITSDVPSSKTCVMCSEDKPVSCFHKDKYTLDGFFSRCKSCQSEYKKTRREALGLEALEVRRATDAKNRDKLREQEKAYRERNRDRVNLKASRYRARKRGLPDTLTEDEIRTIVSHFDNRCSICGGGYEHLDHFIPVSSGHGGTIKENIVPMCEECNHSKRAKNPFEWRDLLPEGDRERFDSLVEYLTELNGIAAVEDYEAHVYQCFN